MTRQSNVESNWGTRVTQVLRYRDNSVQGFQRYQ